MNSILALVSAAALVAPCSYDGLQDIPVGTPARSAPLRVTVVAGTASAQFFTAGPGSGGGCQIILKKVTLVEREIVLPAMELKVAYALSMGLVRFAPTTPHPDIEGISCARITAAGTPRTSIGDFMRLFKPVVDLRIGLAPYEACNPSNEVSRAGSINERDRRGLDPSNDPASGGQDGPTTSQGRPAV